MSDDLVARLFERQDDLSLEAGEVIMALRGANARLRQMLREIRELPPPGKAP